MPGSNKMYDLYAIWQKVANCQRSLSPYFVSRKLSFFSRCCPNNNGTRLFISNFIRSLYVYEGWNIQLHFVRWLVKVVQFQCSSSDRKMKAHYIHNDGPIGLRQDRIATTQFEHLFMNAIWWKCGDKNTRSPTIRLFSLVIFISHMHARARTRLCCHWSWLHCSQGCRKPN